MISNLFSTFVYVIARIQYPGIIIVNYSTNKDIVFQQQRALSQLMRSYVSHC